MNLKTILLVTFFSLFTSYSFSQNIIKMVYSNSKVEKINIGDKVRITYPKKGLPENFSQKKGDEIGIAGIISKINDDNFTLKIKKEKEITLNIIDVIAIKKTNNAGQIATFLGTYAVIGGAVLAGTSQADLNKSFNIAGATLALFPAAIITGSVFYPSKPKSKVGKNYQLVIANDN